MSDRRPLFPGRNRHRKADEDLNGTRDDRESPTEEDEPAASGPEDGQGATGNQRAEGKQRAKGAKGYGPKGGSQDNGGHEDGPPSIRRAQRSFRILSHEEAVERPVTPRRSDERPPPPPRARPEGPPRRTIKVTDETARELRERRSGATTVNPTGGVAPPPSPGARSTGSAEGDRTGPRVRVTSSSGPTEPPKAPAAPAPPKGDRLPRPAGNSVVASAEPVRAQEIRERIIEATYTCVARWGISKTTLEDAAHEAGVSRVTVYRYFPGGRDELVTKVISWEYQRFFTRLYEEVQDAVSLEEVMERGLLFAHRAIAEHEVLKRVLETDPEVLLPKLTVEAESTTELISDFLVPYLLMHGVNPGVDPKEAAEFLARMVLSYIGSPGSWDLDDPAQVAQLVRAELLGGMIRAANHQGQETDGVPPGP